MKRDHVFIYVEEEGQRKFRGFFTDRATAEAWAKKQENPDAYEISDEPPAKKEAAEPPTEVDVADVAGKTDRGLDAALTAVKEAKDA